jgi:hypothetical protein
MFPIRLMGNNPDFDLSRLKEERKTENVYASLELVTDARGRSIDNACSSGLLIEQLLVKRHGVLESSLAVCAFDLGIPVNIVLHILGEDCLL